MSVELVPEARLRELAELEAAVLQILTEWNYHAAKINRQKLAEKIVGCYEQNAQHFVGHAALKYLTLGILWSGAVGVAIPHPSESLAAVIAQVLNQDARRQQAADSRRA